MNAGITKLEAAAEQKFGFKRGTKVNRAAAMYMRPEGATTEEVVAALGGGPQRNLLKVVEQCGASVERIKVPNDRGRPLVRYRIRIEPASIAPPAIKEPTAGPVNSVPSETQRRLEDLDERFGPSLLTWTEGFVAHWIEKNARWAGAPFVRALPGMLSDLGISPLPEEITDVSTYDESALRAFPIYSHLRSLVAYGHFGLSQGNEFWEAFGDKFPDDEGTAETPNAEFPWSWIVPTEGVVLAAHAAAARHSVDACASKDTGVWVIAPHQVAALVDKSVKYIRNLMNPSGNSPLRTDDGGVPAEQVRDWLSQRSDYLPTIVLDSSGLVEQQPAKTLEEIRFIPQAGDGTKFLPKSRTDGGYVVALVTGIETFADYDEALAVLQTASTPSWFEPGEHGPARRVFGAGWIRVSAKEIGGERK